MGTFRRFAAALTAATLLFGSYSAAQILIPTVAPATAPALTPNQVVDLSEWRLDLPENANGELYQDMTRRIIPVPATGPKFTTGTGNYSRSLNAAKQPADLLAGFTSPYFFVSRINGQPWLNMKAPIFGSTSTPDEISNNTRTEFRGLLTGSGPGSLSQRFRGVHRPRISGRWKIVQASAGETSGTADICQIHPAVQEGGYTGPVDSGSVYLIFLWRKSTGALESAVRDVTNPDVIFDDPATTGVVEGRLTVMTDFRVGDELDFTVEWDTRPAQDVLRYTLQKWRNGVAIGGVVNVDHNVQSGWASRYHYLKAGAYSSTNVLDSADAREDPAPAGFPSRNSGGLLAPENVTDVNWIAFRSLTQQLMNPGGLPE